MAARPPRLVPPAAACTPPNCTPRIGVGQSPSGPPNYLGGESNSPAVKRHLKGLTDNSQLRHFFDVRK
eukprot:1175343-Prorocentrum_minimum.AAC.2